MRKRGSDKGKENRLKKGERKDGQTTSSAVGVRV